MCVLDFNIHVLGLDPRYGGHPVQADEIHKNSSLDSSNNSESLRIRPAAAHVANASKTMHRALGRIATGRLPISLVL